MSYELTEATRRHLTRVATQAQRASRVPGLAAGVAHRGRLLWEAGIGAADLTDGSVALGSDTQFPIASNTKTFTATLVMQLRDEGRLTLDDDVADHLPGSAHPGVSIRQLLAHSSGMQREPVGDIWETLRAPEAQDMLENWNEAERVLTAHDRFHYSNLGFMILGEIVAHLDGRPWAQSLQARLLDPLQLRRTTQALEPPHTGLYYVTPFSDVPVEEPVVMTGTMAPAGGLMSTVADLVRWHAFLLDPDSSILRAETVEEMRQPQITVDPAWGAAWGLGLELERRDGRIWFGHTGGAPGSITGAFSHAESRTTSVVLMNNSIARDPAGTAIALGGHVLTHDPEPLSPWTPGTDGPEDLVPLLGLWFSEGSPFFFSVRSGRLEARSAREPDSETPSVFTREAEDVYRAVAGGERGERLVVRRRADGSVRQLNWATYRFTREPLGFTQPTE